MSPSATSRCVRTRAATTGARDELQRTLGTTEKRGTSTVGKYLSYSDATSDKAIREGKRVVRARYGVDPDTCTGDHSCIRLSGCPSLTIRDNPDPLRDDPVAYVNNDCVGCGVCGENAHAAILCPSFYRAELIYNPGGLDQFMARMRATIIGFLQRRADRRRAKLSFGDA